jgi:glycosyltransferase involved in cell wall biosynthesis
VDLLVGYLKSFFQVIRELRWKIIRFSPDLVHANSIRAGLVATAATFDLGTPVVWHLHDMLPRHPLSTAIRIFAALSGRTRMIAVSEAVALNFCGRLASVLEKRVAVILNAIDPNEFAAGQTSGTAIRDGLGLNGAEPILGIVGQLTPRKGQLGLLRAFAQTLTQLPKAMLLIAGAPLFNKDYEYAQHLEDEAKALGINDRVLMLGPRSDVAAIMGALDLLIVNSLVEPAGLVVLEAMACGTPVVATAVGGLPEMIGHGKTGWLVPPGDEQALAAAIVDLWHRPVVRAALAREGKRHVAARFSAARYLGEVEAFYRSSRLLRSKSSES